MRRKVVQHGPATLIVSLPSKWVQKHGVKKGDELEVEEEGNRVVVTVDKGIVIDRKEIDMKQYSLMVNRTIHALYKKGVDEIYIHFDDPQAPAIIQNAIGKETVGYEIIEQGKNYCVVKYIAGQFEDFEKILKRSILMFQSMAKESIELLRKREYVHLRQFLVMEETNNKFTTICRRLINKKGIDMREVGPLYYIIEDFENLFDEYKYMFTYLIEHEKDAKLRKELLDLYQRVNVLIDTFIELYYKFDPQKVSFIGKERKELIKELTLFMEKKPNNVELMVAHHLMVITQKVFCFVGPYLVFSL